MRGLVAGAAKSPAFFVALVLTVLVAAPAARAASTRPVLPAQMGGTHFVLHFDPATASTDYVAAGLADFEESYSRLVAGGGGSPNAGLRAPVGDGTRGGDARTDVYLVAPPWSPTYVGGQAVEDDSTQADPLIDSGFLYMTPSLSRKGFRFRAAHELMHVLQDAYVVTAGLFTESTANWAADFALPDIEPGDSQFSVPFLPFTCSYGDWEGTACGNGYRQWLLFERLTERYGAGFIHRLWMRHRVDCPCLGTTPATDRLILDHAITDEPDDATLASTYADYAEAVWDPTVWTTTAVARRHEEDGPPVATVAGVSREAPSVGATAAVDHLATRYVRVAHAGASGPGDRVRVVAGGGTGRAPRLLLGTGPGRARSVTPMTPAGPGSFEATVSLDAANVTDVVLPLINEGNADDLPFTWRAELLPAGPPAAPSNDLRSNPLRIQPRTTTELGVAYAGGATTEEAPDCPLTRTASRGVWFAVLVDRGRLTIDPTGSDFDAVTAVYDVTVAGRPTLWGCSNAGDRGKLSGDAFAREYLIFVGRADTAAGTGHTLRLAVDGVPNVFASTPPPEDFTAPIVSGLAITPARFRASKRGTPITTSIPSRRGARITFGLDEDATARFVIERPTPGRMVAGRCVKPTKRNRSRKRCTRYLAVATATRSGLRAGTVLLGLTGRRTARRALAAGRYRLRVTATDRLGNGGAPAAYAPFTVKR